MRKYKAGAGAAPAGAGAAPAGAESAPAAMPSVATPAPEATVHNLFKHTNDITTENGQINILFILTRNYNHCVIGPLAHRSSDVCGRAVRPLRGRGGQQRGLQAVGLQSYIREGI